MIDVDIYHEGTDKDTLICSTQISIFPFIINDGHLTERWLPLHRDDERAGDIHVIIQFIPDVIGSINKVRNETQNLHFNVIEGRNIERLCAEQHPLVEIEMNDIGGTVVRTTPDKSGKTRCVWNEELMIPLPENFTYTKDMSMMMSIRDAKDEKNRLIGTCKILLKPNVMNNSYVEDQWFKIYSTKSSKLSGEIRLKYKRGSFANAISMVDKSYCNSGT